MVDRNRKPTEKPRLTPELCLECFKIGVKYDNAAIQQQSRAHLLLMGWDDERIVAALAKGSTT